MVERCPPLLTMAEVARRLGVSHEAIRDRVRRGTMETFPMQRNGRALIRIPESALDTPVHKSGRPRKEKQKTPLICES